MSRCGSLVARFARSRGPFTTREANERFGRDVEPELRALERAEQARPRRASSRRQRARVVRPRGAPAAPARVARGAPPRGRAGRAGDDRPLLAELARDRPAGDSPRGARPAPVALAAGLALGERGAAEARPRLSPGTARPALRDRRGRLGRSRARPRRAVLPRGRRRARPPLRRADARRRGTRRDSRRTGDERRVLVRPARRHGARGRGRPAGALGSRVGGRGDERRLAAAQVAASLRDAASRTATAPILAGPWHRGHGDAGQMVARRSPLRRRPGPPRARRAPARAAGDRHARRCPR